MANLSDTRTRAEVLSDAALEVLATEGGRGLTHRAVDVTAGLPAGSTSNVYNSRTELVSAALARHVELELAFIQAVRSNFLKDGGVVDTPVHLINQFIELSTTGDLNRLALARFELYLEVRRRPELAEQLETSRNEFVNLTAQVLTLAGVSNGNLIARQFVALIDGFTADRLFHEKTALTSAERESYINQLLEAHK